MGDDALEQPSEKRVFAPSITGAIGGEIRDLVAPEILGEGLQGVEHQTGDRLQRMRPMRLVIVDADDLAAVLLEEGRVVIMPGTGFGDSRYLRLSFAASRTELEDALDAMARLLGRVDS